MRESSREYIEYLKKTKNISENTVMSYKQDLDKMIRFFEGYGIVQYTFMKEMNLDSYILHLELEGKSTATIKRTIAVLKGYFDYLFKTHKIPHCITMNLVRPSIKAMPKPAMESDDRQAIINQADGESRKNKRDWLMLKLICDVGLQVTELIHLKVSDINYEIGIIHCNKEHKSHAYAVDGVTMDKLQSYVEEQRLEYVKDSDTTTLFLNRSGDPMSRQSVWKMMQGYARKAGVKEVTSSRLKKS